MDKRISIRYYMIILNQFIKLKTFHKKINNISPMEDNGNTIESNQLLNKEKDEMLTVEILDNQGILINNLIFPFRQF